MIGPDTDEQQSPPEVENLKRKLEESESILAAIRSGEVDALVVGTPGKERVYTLRGADQPYRLFVESMPEGAVTLGADGTMIYVNSSFASMLGTELTEVIGRSITDFIPVEHLPSFSALLQNCTESGCKFETALSRSKRLSVPTQLSIRPVDFEDTRAFCLVATDLTEQRRNQALLASERLARSILEQAAEAIVVVDETGLVIRASKRAIELAGEHPLFQPFEMVYPLEPIDHVGSCYEVRPEQEIANCEVRLLRPRGERLNVMLNSGPLRDGNGSLLGAVITMTDITALRRASEALVQLNQELEARVEQRTAALTHKTEQVRALASALTLAEQRERKRIAQLLHDDLQQMLHGMQLKLQLLRMDALTGDQEEVLVRMGQIETLMRNAIQATRTLAVELSPSVLKNESLKAGLDWLSIQMQSAHGLTVDVRSEGDFTLPIEELRVLLYQIVRELLFNVVKHSGIMAATVTVAQEDNAVSVVIEDEGCGFDVSTGKLKHANTGSFGLFSVQQRIDLVSGRMDVTSEPGKGTRVSISVPVPTGVRVSAPRELAQSPTRVYIAAGNALIREGYVALIELESDLVVAGEAGRASHVLKNILETASDAVIVDASLPDLNSIELLRRIRAHRPYLPAVLMSGPEDGLDLNAVAASENIAYLDRTEAASELIATIRRVAGRALTNGE